MAPRPQMQEGPAYLVSRPRLRQQACLASRTQEGPLAAPSHQGLVSEYLFTHYREIFFQNCQQIWFQFYIVEMNRDNDFICVLAFGATPATNTGGSLFGQQSTTQTTGGLFASPASNTSFGAKTPGFGGSMYMYLYFITKQSQLNRCICISNSDIE